MQGTILVFNVDPHLDCQELAGIFSTYGEVKRIQEVPDKKDHKLIEFYDIRSANLAMQAINRAVVAGSHSRPDGQTEGAVAVQQPTNLQAMGSGGSGDLSVRLQLWRLAIQHTDVLVVCLGCCLFGLQTGFAYFADVVGEVNADCSECCEHLQPLFAVLGRGLPRARPNTVECSFMHWPKCHCPFECAVGPETALLCVLICAR